MHHYSPANLSMKEGSLFLVSLERSQRRGVHGLGSMMFGLVVQKFLNIE